ncbi:MAG: 50S ribosomal protein L15e [Candidatus Ranarchaeia archaeon]
MPSAYKYMEESFRKSHKKGTLFRDIQKSRLISWRKEGAGVRVDKPTRLSRARALGYKAKQGFVIVRQRVRRGGLHKSRPIKGHRPKRMGFKKHTPNQNIRGISEFRAQNKYPNLRVLNSYYVGQDGKHKYYEVILVDPAHPQIMKDKDVGWICKDTHKNRHRRGLTSAGKKSRGLRA